MFSVMSLRWFLRLDVGVPNRSNLGLSVRHHRAICSIFHSFCFCVVIFSLCASNSTTSTRTSKWKSALQVLKKRQNVNIKMSDYLLVWCLILCPNSWFWDSNQSIFETQTFNRRFDFDHVAEGLYVRLEAVSHFEVQGRVVELKNVKILVITNRKTIWKIEQTSKQCFQWCL